MTDREKVIKGLEHCDFGGSGTCYEKECPYYQSHDCTDELKNDILVLLKEQETIVRCKDCKYYRYYGLDSYIYSECTIGMTDGPIPTWFCAGGERR